VTLYDRETGLQYSPKDAETKHIARNMPIMLDGEATGDEEVSGFRDLDRVDTNNPRGGMCLVLAEGIALKAPKIQRYTRNLEEVDWPWLQDLIDGTVGEGDDERDEGDEAGEGDREDAAGTPAGPARVDPSGKYLRDLIAGRPVFGHPSRPGGFRLRYGRARNHGFATAGVHPATMHLVDDFLATGTQLKTERPGKAAGVVPVDSIEGPTVRLANGEVRRIDDPEEALAVRNGVEAVLDLGEYLVNYGEFVENNHPLAPASYTVEWWVQDLEAAGADVQALRDDPHVDLAAPSAEQALAWADEYDAPLHPAYTYLWHDVSVETFAALADAVADGEVTGAESDPPGVLVIERTETTRDALEALLVEHVGTADALRVPDWRPLARSLGVTDGLRKEWTLADLPAEAREWDGGDNAVAAVREVAPFGVRERAPTRIGGRMGRPEKSETRELSPAVHALFPIGEAGGSQRNLGEAARTRGPSGARGELTVQLGVRACPDCGERAYTPRCPECGSHTDPHYECDSCGQAVEPDESGRVVCDRCDRDVTSPEEWTVDLNTAFRDALEAVGERESAFEILKGVKGLSSSHKTPEPIEKGVLRAKHGVSSFKDGTVRYDMTDLPVTAVRPDELDVTADHFRELGYETDVEGDPLRFDDQLVELKVQDVVLSDGAAEHMLRTADYVDDLLESLYDLPAFYELNDREDLVGELVFGMAPHTSAAVVGRVVGFTSAAVGYAHPYFHAAKRRNCFHPSTKLWYRDEDDEWHHGRVDEFVEERLDPETAREDDVGTLASDLEGDVFVPSLTGEGEETLQPVEAVSKHPAPDHLVRVETRSGREIRVTPDHEVHVFDGAEVRSKQAAALSEDDHLVTPAHLDAVDATGTGTFDLLAEFVRRDVVANDRLMVEGLPKEELYDLFTDVLAGEWGGKFYPLQSTADHLGLTKKRLSNYLCRERVPVDLLSEFFESTDAMLRWVPDDVRIGVKRDRTSIDRTIEVTERVATLLGFYAAEGLTREQETSKGSVHQTTVCGTEQHPREFLLETLREAFGVDPYRENDAKVTVSGRLPRAFFETVLDAGTSAETKRVPRCIFDAGARVVEAYLSGYFSGDGPTASDAVGVSATTVSRELKEDLLALCSRLGIAARVTVTEPVPVCEKFPDDYAVDDPATSVRSYVLSISSDDAVRFADRVEFHLDREDEQLAEQLTSTESDGQASAGASTESDGQASAGASTESDGQASAGASTESDGHASAGASTETRGRRVFDGGGPDCLVEAVAAVEHVASDTDYTYCLTVESTHSLVANDLSVKQCDGDEDCVMLLMDGLLNFSKEYLPDQRGGRMDAPLVMSSRIDPTEIDDEAHNMDVVREYPREFYEATLEMADPESVDVAIAEESLGTDDEYRGFDHTHDTTDIHMGPALSAYKTLGSMMEKMDAQLELARKLQGVDETDVAERVIEYHFLPDLIGNLRAFARQETRCLDCGEKYRRMPLSGDCRECGGRVNLTVHEGSVNKYMDTAVRVAEEYGCRDYTKQRLEVLERSLDSVFQNDHNRASKLEDFM
jgi:DNA polymerase II large subunit